MQSCLMPQLTTIDKTAPCEGIANLTKTCLSRVHGDEKPSDGEVERYTAKAVAAMSTFNPNCPFDIRAIVQEIWPSENPNTGRTTVSSTTMRNSAAMTTSSFIVTACLLFFGLIYTAKRV